MNFEPRVISSFLKNLHCIIQTLFHLHETYREQIEAQNSIFISTKNNFVNFLKGIKVVPCSHHCILVKMVSTVFKGMNHLNGMDDLYCAPSDVARL